MVKKLSTCNPFSFYLNQLTFLPTLIEIIRNLYIYGVFSCEFLPNSPNNQKYLLNKPTWKFMVVIRVFPSQTCWQIGQPWCIIRFLFPTLVPTLYLLLSNIISFSIFKKKKKTKHFHRWTGIPFFPFLHPAYT